MQESDQTPSSDTATTPTDTAAAESSKSPGKNKRRGIVAGSLAALVGLVGFGHPRHDHDASSVNTTPVAASAPETTSTSTTTEAPVTPETTVPESTTSTSITPATDVGQPEQIDTPTTVAPTPPQIQISNAIAQKEGGPVFDQADPSNKEDVGSGSTIGNAIQPVAPPATNALNNPGEVITKDK